MPDENDGELNINNDTVETIFAEDQDSDTLNDTVDALDDDEASDEGQTDPEEGDSKTDDEQSADDDETDADKDLTDDENVLVTLDDGEQIPLGELKNGYFRQKDYTHKTEALAAERKSVEEVRDDYNQYTQQIQSVFQNIDGFLQNMIPPEPDYQLAQADPQAYAQQTALRNEAIKELQGLYAVRDYGQATIQGASEADFNRYLAREGESLLQAMPELKEPGRIASFLAANEKTAQEFGFSQEEVESTTDHRVLQLVHYARLGKQAEQNRKNAGRRVAEKLRKGKRPNSVAGTAKNHDAMKRLAKSGSLDDAVAALEGG